MSTLPSSVQLQIGDAVAVGLTVYAPQNEIDLGYWKGDGYIAVDPLTGSGAYIIKSGTNGGDFEACEEKAEPLQVSIAKQILTYLAIAAAIILIALLEIPTAGGALPAAMAILGMTTLTFSMTSYAAGKCKSNEKCHRGSLQAQGTDMTDGVGQNKGLTKSASWAQITPLTLSEGLAKLNELQIQLTPAQLSVRLPYFIRAEAHIRYLATLGGVCAPHERNFPDARGGEPGLPSDIVKKGIRVDVVVNAGQAFSP